VYAQWVATLEASYQLVWGLSLAPADRALCEQFGYDSDVFFLFLAGCYRVNVVDEEAVGGSVARGQYELQRAVTGGAATQLRREASRSRPGRSAAFALCARITWAGDTVAYLSGGRLENIRLLLR